MLSAHCLPHSLNVDSLNNISALIWSFTPFQILLDINTVQNVENVASNASASVAWKSIGFKNADRLDINALNAKGESCLYIAVRNTVVSEAIVLILLQAGADPRVGTTDSLPIHLAVEKSLIE